METDILNQKAWSKCPLCLFNTTAKTSKTAVSVRIVPPIVTETTWFFVIPNLLTIGYETNVWVENIAAVSMLAFIPMSSK